MKWQVPAVLECSLGGDSRAPTVAVLDGLNKLLHARWCATTGGRCPGEVVDVGSRGSTWTRLLTCPLACRKTVVYPQLQLMDKVLVPRFDDCRGRFLGPCTQVQGRGPCPQDTAPITRCICRLGWRDTLVEHIVRTTPPPPPPHSVAILAQPYRFELLLTAVQTVEGERSWCGSLVKMVKGIDIGAHGNGISFVPRVGASPSLLLRGVVWKVSLAWSAGLFLCFEILFFSHVLQPPADVKFGSVFSGETVSKGHVSACSELESVELGGLCAHSFGDILCEGSPSVHWFVLVSLGCWSELFWLGVTMCVWAYW